MDDMVIVFETPLGAAILRPRSWCDECRKNGRPVLPGMARVQPKSRSFKKRYWTPKEDERVRALAENMDRVHFATIAQHIPGRSVQSVTERYRNHLDTVARWRPRTAPRPRSNEWTAEEDATLFQHRDVKYISKHILPKRTVRAIRDRRTLLRRRQAGRQPPSS